MNSITAPIDGFGLGEDLHAARPVRFFDDAGMYLVIAGKNSAISVGLIVLAFAQIGVHLVFFLHLGSSPDSTNNILALAFGVLIVFLIITGSIWIIANLQSNMMPMSVH
jgi:cytochrome o ubiquinol oxidase operon protein cyoD